MERKELRLVLAIASVEGKDNQLAEILSNQIMEEYDVNHDEKITFDEFLNGLQKWSIELNQEKLNRVSFSFKSFSVFVFVCLNLVCSNKYGWKSSFSEDSVSNFHHGLYAFRHGLIWTISRDLSAKKQKKKKQKTAYGPNLR